jgi:hypothetical protein
LNDEMEAKLSRVARLPFALAKGSKTVFAGPQKGIENSSPPLRGGSLRSSAELARLGRIKRENQSHG